MKALSKDQGTIEGASPQPCAVPVSAARRSEDDVPVSATHRRENNGGAAALLRFALQSSGHVEHETTSTSLKPIDDAPPEQRVPAWLRASDDGDNDDDDVDACSGGMAASSALASFLTHRYLWSCRVPAGHLDRQLERSANSEIIYSSRESTVLALVHERRYTHILILVSVLMMLFCIPGILVVKTRSVHHAAYFRFTALALRGLPATSPGIESFGLRFNGCRLPGAKHNVTFQGASVLMTFLEPQAMDGWYFVVIEGSPERYPVRFKLEASNDNRQWWTVGASAWTCINGWHEYDSGLETRGMPIDWDLSPPFPWIFSQVAVPLAAGASLLIGTLLGMHSCSIFTAQFVVAFGVFCSALMSAWSTFQSISLASTDTVAIVDAGILAIGRTCLLLTVAMRPKSCHECLAACGVAMFAADIAYQGATLQRITPRFIWCDALLGCTVLAVSLVTRARKILLAERMIAGDQHCYAEEWQRVLIEQHCALQSLQACTDQWAHVYVGTPMQHNVKREENMRTRTEDSGDSKQWSWFGSLLELKSVAADDRGMRIASQLDMSSPVTSLDQVLLNTFLPVTVPHTSNV
jgi:hypothetical protein